jgi:hypothetical protein
LADIERAERADVSAVLQAGRKTLSIVPGKRHQNIELLLQRQATHAPLPAKESGNSIPKKSRKSRGASLGRLPNLGESNADGFLRPKESPECFSRGAGFPGWKIAALE